MLVDTRVHSGWGDSLLGTLNTMLLVSSTYVDTVPTYVGDSIFEHAQLRNRGSILEIYILK